MRLVLPILALIITALVFTWSHMEESNIIPVQEEESKTSRAVAKNELINPNFQSKDDKSQPYTITAKRAVQDRMDDDLVTLEKPVADILLNDGRWLAVKARGGSYDQGTRLLNLDGDVHVFHDSGYQLQTQKLRVDLRDNTAHSDTKVHIQGPAGTLQARGLTARRSEQTLVFDGPARLSLSMKDEDNEAFDLLLAD